MKLHFGGAHFKLKIRSASKDFEEERDLKLGTVRIMLVT